MKTLAMLLIAITGLLSGCVAYPARDRDRDGIADRADRDRDGDRVPNVYDRRPDDPRRY